MKITLIRHGETDWNLERRMQGSIDIELNETGIKQASSLAKRLANEPCNIIYSSDLQRAKKTAEIINNFHNVEIIISAYLRETNFGQFEGRIIDEMLQSEIIEYSNKHAPAYFAKVGAYLDEILSKNEYEHIFIVAHSGTVRAVICHLLRLTVEQRELYSVDNTAIYTFEKVENSDFIITLENDTNHLNH
ncbi:MAG: histidine phosphatase family protein [Defluviitaleaceae bacterium]|nr:histidine phosphatase family protein [Defluviitaleaceae bacterium]